MARITLQIKNVVSLALATAASVAWGIGSKRFFDTPQRPWIAFVIAGMILLSCQLALIFVESKEEEELSLIRKQRIDGVRLATLEDEKLSIRIQQEIENGNLKDVKAWNEFRSKRHGK